MSKVSHVEMGKMIEILCAINKVRKDVIFCCQEHDFVLYSVCNVHIILLQLFKEKKRKQKGLSEMLPKRATKMCAQCWPKK